MSLIKVALPSFLREESETKFRPLFATLAEKLRKGHLQFLCGAGLSCESGLPDFYSLAYEMLQLIFKPKSDDEKAEKRLQRLLEFFEATAIAEVCKDPRSQVFNSDLWEVITERFKGKEPKKGHHILGTFASNGWLQRIYTTNFDDLIERGIGKACKTVTDGKLRQLRLAESEKVPAVIHLHNTLEGDFLITEGDLYRKGFDSALIRIFQADLASHAFVFLGYSLNDPNLKSIYLKTLDLLEDKDSKLSESKMTYVVVPLSRNQNEEDKLSPKDYEEEMELARHKWRIAEPLWNSRGATLIPMKATPFLEALEDKIKEVGIETKRRELEEAIPDPGKRKELVDLTLEIHPDMQNEEEKALDFLILMYR